ncbi:hypothetical protein ABPG72_020401 [Tetrahymena utriculariae]
MDDHICSTELTITGNQESNFEKQDYFLPSSDGNFIFLASDSTPIKIMREEIDQVIKICPMSGNESKCIAFTKEKIFLVNPENGQLEKFEDIEDDYENYLNHYDNEKIQIGGEKGIISFNEGSNFQLVPLQISTKLKNQCLKNKQCSERLIFSVDIFDDKDYIRDVMTCIDNLRKGRMMIEEISDNNNKEISNSSNSPIQALDFAKDNKQQYFCLPYQLSYGRSEDKSSSQKQNSQEEADNVLEKISKEQEQQIQKQNEQNNKHEKKSQENDQNGNEFKGLQINRNKVLGYGVQGTVIFEGTFQGRDIAVKQLLKDNKDLASKEIQMLINLQHKNIIKYYYFEETKEHILLGLEKCVGNINDLIDYSNRKNKKKSEQDLKALCNIKKDFFTKSCMKNTFKDCLDGLSYLHSQSVIHRYIRIENILINYNKEIKLADFGLSKNISKTNIIFTNDLDVLSLWCDYYYIYTQGSHPFGEQQVYYIKKYKENQQQNLTQSGKKGREIQLILSTI